MISKLCRALDRARQFAAEVRRRLGDAATAALQQRRLRGCGGTHGTGRNCTQGRAMASYQYVHVMKDLTKAYPDGREVCEGITLPFLPG